MIMKLLMCFHQIHSSFVGIVLFHLVVACLEVKICPVQNRFRLSLPTNIRPVLLESVLEELVDLARTKRKTWKWGIIMPVWELVTLVVSYLHQGHFLN